MKAIYLTVFVLIMRNDLAVINVLLLGSKGLRQYICSLGLIIMVKRIYSMYVGAVLKV